MVRIDLKLENGPEFKNRILHLSFGLLSRISCDRSPAGNEATFS